MAAQIFTLLLCAYLFLGGCGDDEPVKKVDLSQREEVTVYRPVDAITYAYLPQYAHTVSYERHHLMVEYLSRAIRGDREKLKQFWLNLLNNAFESIGRHGTNRVTSKLCPYGNHVVVTMADT
jgi:C4-dicarboxylate-specific signal transduction histidine kinase